jgi:hypothetical protein
MHPQIIGASYEAALNELKTVKWPPMSISTERKVRKIATNVLLEYKDKPVDFSCLALRKEINGKFNKLVSEYLDELDAECSCGNCRDCKARKL